MATRFSFVSGFNDCRRGIYYSIYRSFWSNFLWMDLSANHIFWKWFFRKIEYWIDGDRGKQIRLEKQPWNAEKIKKRVLKWFIFFIISFLIANVFLAYLIGGDTVISYVTGNPFDNTSTLISLLIFTGVFLFHIRLV